MELDNKGLNSLKEHLERVPDPRESYKVTYPLEEILFLVVCGVVCDCREWQLIVDFGQMHLDWFRRYYPYKSGIASHDTINRVFSLVDKKAFADMFVEWVNGKLKLEAGSLISLDGKYSRSSASKLEQQTPREEGGKKCLHLVSAWCNDLSLCISSREVPDKSNETASIDLILNDLEVSGCVMSMDAMFCHKDIVGKITRHKADYIIGLKLNQESLYTACEMAFEEAGNEKHVRTFRTEVEVDHGRVEQRTCRVISVAVLPQWAKVNDWPGCKNIVEVETDRAVMSNAEQSRDKRLFITSLDIAPNKLLEYVRGHWGIENKLHWTLDVYFGDDMSRKRAGNAAANFSLVLRAALNLLKKHPDKASLNRKMKKCSWDDRYRQEVIGI